MSRYNGDDGTNIHDLPGAPNLDSSNKNTRRVSLHNSGNFGVGSNSKGGGPSNLPVTNLYDGKTRRWSTGPSFYHNSQHSSNKSSKIPGSFYKTEPQQSSYYHKGNASFNKSMDISSKNLSPPFLEGFESSATREPSFKRTKQNQLHLNPGPKMKGKSVLSIQDATSSRGTTTTPQSSFKSRRSSLSALEQQPKTSPFYPRRLSSTAGVDFSPHALASKRRMSATQLTSHPGRPKIQARRFSTTHVPEKTSSNRHHDNQHHQHPTTLLKQARRFSAFTDTRGHQQRKVAFADHPDNKNNNQRHQNYSERDGDVPNDAIEANYSGDLSLEDDDELYREEKPPSAGGGRKRAETSASAALSDFSDDSMMSRMSTNDVNYNSNDRDPVTIFGFELPHWVPQPPKAYKLAIMLAKYAPCFLCCRMKQVTDRAVLGRLNVILSFLSMFTVTAAIVVGLLFLNPLLMNNMEVEIPPQQLSPPLQAEGLFCLISTIMNAALGLSAAVGLTIFISNILTARVVRDVNLVGASRYWTAIHWALPFCVLSAILLFDYFHFTDVWIKHWWRSKNFLWFRWRYCEGDTYNTLCTVPIAVNATLWCEINYNATNCADIRDQAQRKAGDSLLALYFITSAWNVFLIITLLMALTILERIMTKPIVTKKKESSGPSVLILPSSCCLFFGIFVSVSQISALNISFSQRGQSRFQAIGPLFVISGAIFSLACLILYGIQLTSITNSNDKRSKLLLINVLITLMVIDLLIMLVIFILSSVFSAGVSRVTIHDSMRGSIACALPDASDCTDCDKNIYRCPEWTEHDIDTLLRTQVKVCAAVALVFSVYAIRVVRLGILMRKVLASYQIEYI